jgi:molecular chaperone HtpG
MVTEQIIVRTRSAKTPESILEWVGKPDGTYNIKKLENAEIPVGTQVILSAKTKCEEYFFEEEVISLVRYFGLPLPFPVVLAKGDTETIINGFGIEGGMNYVEIMKLGEQLFDEKFIDFIPLESSKGHFSGVAFILPYEASPYNKNSHRIYLKNMLLTEDGGMILPKWAFFVKCFLNTTTLRPTASRENFYKDGELEEAKAEIAQCISQYFVRLSNKNPELLQKIIGIHYLAIKAVAVTDDELFKIFIPHIGFFSTLGKISGRQIIEYGEKIYYTANTGRYKQIEPFFISQMRLLINAGYIYDWDLINKIKSFHEETDIELIREEGMNEFLMDISANEESKASLFMKIAGFTLENFDCEPQLKKYHPDSLPVFYYLDEIARQAKAINETMDKVGDVFKGMLSGFAEELEEVNRPVLYFNMNNPLVKTISEIKDMQKIRTMTEILYVQALLTGHFPVTGDEMELLNNGILKLLKNDSNKGE